MEQHSAESGISDENLLFIFILDTACDPTQSADLAAVIMQEGLAYVCLVTSSMTLTRAKIELNIPRKRRGDCSQHDKGMTKFYDQVMQAIIRHVNFDGKCCLGFP